MIGFLVGCSSRAQESEKTKDKELADKRGVFRSPIQEVAGQLVPGAKVTVVGDALVVATKDGGCDPEALVVLRDAFADLDEPATSVFRVLQCPGGSVQLPPENKNAQRDRTKARIRRYATEAYPKWAAEHPDRPCPDKLTDLNQYMKYLTGRLEDERAQDGWGGPLEMRCGAKLPPGAKGFAVFSLGKDGKEGTDDDIQSWALGG